MLHVHVSPSLNVLYEIWFTWLSNPMSVLPFAENDPTASYNLIADLLTNNNLRKNLMVLFFYLMLVNWGLSVKTLKGWIGKILLCFHWLLSYITYFETFFCEDGAWQMVEKLCRTNRPDLAIVRRILVTCSEHQGEPDIAAQVTASIATWAHA